MGDVVEQTLGLFGDREDRKMATRAGELQQEQTALGMQDIQRAREEGREILSPYVYAGNAASGFGPIGPEAAKLAELQKQRDAEQERLQQMVDSSITLGNYGDMSFGDVISGNFDDQMTPQQLASAQAMRQQKNRVNELDGQVISAESSIPQGSGQSLQDFTNTGFDALEVQRSLAGLNGPEAQDMAIQQVENNPEFQTLMNQGEEAILENAAATGGLRGGNTQRALMEFRPSLLASQINKQYNRMGGFAGAGANLLQAQAGLGQASAAGVAGQGMGAANNLAQLRGDMGASKAGVAMMPSGFGSFIKNQREGYARDQGFVQGLAGTAVGSYFGGMGGGMGGGF